MAKIIVVGGAGHVGSRVVEKLAAHGHEAVAASRRTGVDAFTGEGLAEALQGADVVVDVMQAPSYVPDEVRDFFTTSSANLVAAEKAAGVRHHVALTIVGTDRPQGIGYFHGKAEQERVVRESGVPFSLVHATQFFEFTPAIIGTATQGDTVRVSSASIQPIAADDVATAVARFAVGEPVGDVEVAGPEVLTIGDLVRRTLAAQGVEREVVTADDAPYFGAAIEERTLCAVDGAELFETRLDDWLSVVAAGV
jgi:uncharacterized protein YbjT (DUF2867 family)